MTVTSMPIRSANKFAAALAGLAAVLTLAACASVGTPTAAASVDAGQLRDLDTLEARLPGLLNRPDRAQRQAFEAEVRRLLAQPSYNDAYKAALWGLLAESAWRFQDRPLVEQAAAAMAKLDPGQDRLAVARARLAKPGAGQAILQAALKADASRPHPAVSLELALEAAAAQRYREAAAWFDDAFQSLSPNWVALYREQRDAAYRQKDLAPPADDLQAKLIAQATVTLQSLAGIMLAQTRYLDRYGKDSLASGGADLYARLEGDGLLESGQTEAGPAAAVNRAEAAWFLFRLAVREEKRPELLQGGKAWSASPIPDLALDDPAFRSVLGVVQREILNLPDGVNFRPGEALLTADYLKAIERLRSLYP